MNEGRDKHIGIGIFPQSNLFCGHIKSVGDLGIETCFAHGIQVSINSDDPAMFGYTLSDTFKTMFDYYSGMSIDDLAILTQSAIRSAFCRHEEKQKLLEHIATYL